MNAGCDGILGGFLDDVITRFCGWLQYFTDTGIFSFLSFGFAPTQTTERLVIVSG